MTTIGKIKWLNKGMALQRRVSQETKTAEIYCGDEDRAHFLVQALGELGFDVDYEIYTVDGKYHVEVNIQ